MPKQTILRPRAPMLTGERKPIAALPNVAGNRNRISYDMNWCERMYVSNEHF